MIWEKKSCINDWMIISNLVISLVSFIHSNFIHWKSWIYVSTFIVSVEMKQLCVIYVWTFNFEHFYGMITKTWIQNSLWRRGYQIACSFNLMVLFVVVRLAVFFCSLLIRVIFFAIKRKFWSIYKVNKCSVHQFGT